jgi:hypothetical protein
MAAARARGGARGATSGGAAAGAGAPAAGAPRAAPARASKRRAPETLGHWAARRQNALWWSKYLAFLAIFWFTLGFYMLEYTWSYLKMGLTWPRWADIGLNASEFGYIMALAALFGLAATAAQDLVWPLMARERRGEKVRGPPARRGAARRGAGRGRVGEARPSAARRPALLHRLTAPRLASSPHSRCTTALLHQQPPGARRVPRHTWLLPSW